MPVLEYMLAGGISLSHPVCDCDTSQGGLLIPVGIKHGIVPKYVACCTGKLFMSTSHSPLSLRLSHRIPAITRGCTSSRAEKYIPRTGGLTVPA